MRMSTPMDTSEPNEDSAWILFNDLKIRAQWISACSTVKKAVALAEMFSLSKQHELRREATCVDIGKSISSGVYNAQLVDCSEMNIVGFEHTEV
ncbi:hypothetical protein COOONC_24221 [Cooperia oncophora]